MAFGFNATCYFGLFLTFALLQGELEPELTQQDSSPVPVARFVGTEACVHCHKGGHNFPTHAAAGKEYSIWVSSDPHSRAYNTLFSEQSKSIANKLKLESPPHKSDLCLNCHATHVPSGMKAPSSKLNPADGVGCESCHGGAENWLVPHKLADWQFWSPSQKESTGFVNTDNFASRTRKCVECHIGSKGREVNHDLIAAGHPRLLFEMSAYQAMLPRHWSRAKDLARNSPTAEAKLWLVGQLVSAEAAVDHLERRAINTDSPWPEFAEYDCFSCHHDLADRSWKNKGNPFDNSDGRPDWGTWHFTLLDQLALDLSLSVSADTGGEFNRLRFEMQKTLPDRDQVVVLSNDFKSRLAQIADGLSSAPLTETEAIRISHQLFGGHPDGDQRNWDELAPRFLAAVALRQSLMDSRRLAGRLDSREFEESGKRLLEIRDSLKFVDNYQRPVIMDASQSKAIQRSFSEIFDQLGNWRSALPFN